MKNKLLWGIMAPAAMAVGVSYTPKFAPEVDIFSAPEVNIEGLSFTTMESYFTAIKDKPKIISPQLSIFKKNINTDDFHLISIEFIKDYNNNLTIDQKSCPKVALSRIQNNPLEKKAIFDVFCYTENLAKDSRNQVGMLYVEQVKQ